MFLCSCRFSRLVCSLLSFSFSVYIILKDINKCGGMSMKSVLSCVFFCKVIIKVRVSFMCVVHVVCICMFVRVLSVNVYFISVSCTQVLFVMVS